jgi:hypothetical protein
MLVKSSHYLLNNLHSVMDEISKPIIPVNRKITITLLYLDLYSEELLYNNSRATFPLGVNIFSPNIFLSNFGQRLIALAIQMGNTKLVRLKTNKKRMIIVTVDLSIYFFYYQLLIFKQ